MTMPLMWPVFVGLVSTLRVVVKPTNKVEDQRRLGPGRIKVIARRTCPGTLGSLLLKSVPSKSTDGHTENPPHPRGSLGLGLSIPKTKHQLQSALWSVPDEATCALGWGFPSRLETPRTLGCFTRQQQQLLNKHGHPCRPCFDDEPPHPRSPPMETLFLAGPQDRGVRPQIAVGASG